MQIGILGLDVALDDALAEVDGSGEVVGVEFAVFANVDENELVVAIEPGFDFVNVGFTDALLGVFDNLEKARRMLMAMGVSGAILAGWRVLSSQLSGSRRGLRGFQPRASSKLTRTESS